MLSINPFVELSSSIPIVAMQGFVVLMFVLVYSVCPWNRTCFLIYTSSRCPIGGNSAYSDITPGFEI